jgi:hypothetical protein
MLEMPDRFYRPYHVQYVPARLGRICGGRVTRLTEMCKRRHGFRVFPMVAIG